MKIRKRKLFLVLIILLFISGGFYGWSQYKAFMAVPATRLAEGDYYPQMPPDDHHIYIRLPIDHHNPSLGGFTDFYILSPNFKPGSPVVFQIFDNQQEMVGMVVAERDFQVFDERIGKDISYVLIGNRGVSPTLFPEVFNPDGSINYSLAMDLYGSNQQIEDIEAVRQDMAKRGLLPKDGKIMLLGGSGAGVLTQQYLDKYGGYVSRVLIESTGAVDLAGKNNLTFAKNFYDSNPEAAQCYYQLDREGKTNPSLAWILFKTGLEGNTQLQTDLLNGKNHPWDIGSRYLYVKNWFKLPQNFPMINLIFSSPQELEVKVRIWELIGGDLVKYQPASAREVNLMYEPMKIIMADFLKAYGNGKIKTLGWDLNRAEYQGEVLIWANTGDQDFGPEIAKLISDAYPHAVLVVFDEKAHRVLKKSDFQLALTKAFFESGLNSEETVSRLKENDNKVTIYREES